MKFQEFTSKIIERAFKVHNKLGFGFLETVYQNALMIELDRAGLQPEKDKRIKVEYDGHIVGDYIADIVVNDKVILEAYAIFSE